ncbi:MAG: hypothetical protein WBN94_09930 [Methanothrix sp.]
MEVAVSYKAAGPGSLPGRYPARPGAEGRAGRDDGLDDGIGRRRYPQPGPPLCGRMSSWKEPDKFWK